MRRFFVLIHGRTLEMGLMGAFEGSLGGFGWFRVFVFDQTSKDYVQDIAWM